SAPSNSKASPPSRHLMSHSKYLRRTLRPGHTDLYPGPSQPPCVRSSRRLAPAPLSPISAAPARRRADAESSLREPFVPKLLLRIADRANVRIELEPEFGYAGRIVFADGTSHPFKAGNLNINRGGAMAIADDKSYTSFFLRQAGLRTPRELTFFSEKLRAN